MTDRKFNAGKIISSVLWTCSAALLVRAVFPMFQVSGESMSPTLEDGEFIITRRCRRAGKGEVVIFRHGGDLLIKRVTAVSGELVEITPEGCLMLDGKAVNEPFAHGRMKELAVTVPENSYFLMGDNRGVSVDSRSDKIGCVHKSRLYSKAVFRIYPFSKAGYIK